MENIGIISFYGLVFGIIGTSIGGFIGAFLKISSDKYLCFILEFAAGLMTSIICFDLIPEALNIVNISLCILGIFIGILSMIYCDKLVNKYCKASTINLTKNSMFGTGLIIAIGLAIHNFPEGLAIGAGFESSSALGLKLAIAIALHDVPEGISISLPLKTSGTSKIKAILITTISGLTTGLGAFFGVIVGNISESLIGLSLSFAAGAMLYIVTCELIPESKKRYSGRFASLGNMLGIIIGLFSKVL